MAALKITQQSPSLNRFAGAGMGFFFSHSAFSVSATSCAMR